MFTPLVVWLSWLMDGIMFAIVSAIPLFFIYPDDLKFEKQNYVVYQKFTGFLGRCCVYEVFEDKFYLFEKRIGIIRYEGSIKFDKAEINIEGEKTSLRFEYTDFDEVKKQEVKKDTSIFIDTQ